MKSIFYFRAVVTILSIFFLIPDSLSQSRTLKYNTPATDNCNGYYEYLPKGYTTKPTEKFPLLLYFHGIGVTGDGSVGVLENVVNLGWGTPPWRSWRGSSFLPDVFTVNSKQMEFILICPMFIQEAYTNPNKYINDFIDYCVSHYRVDESRIYISGQSGNASAVLEFVGKSMANAARIAGVASSSPASSGSQAYGDVIAAGNIPVWIAASEYERTGDPGAYRRNAQSWYNYIINANPSQDYAPRLSIVPDYSPTVHNGHGDAAAYLYHPATNVGGMNVYQWLLQFHKSVLPVTGMDIQAKRIDESLLLTWDTHSEIHNSGFNVQQSGDGVTFQNVGFVASSGTSNGGSYSFSIKNPLNGINYLRLEQIDLDGRKSYSNVVSIHFAGLNKIVVAPNPVHQVLTLNFNTAFRNATIQIFDNTGKLIKEVKIDNTPQKQIKVGDLSAGIYNGRVIKNGGNLTFTFLKK